MQKTTANDLGVGVGVQQTMQFCPGQRLFFLGLLCLVISLAGWSLDINAALAQGEIFDDPTPTTADIFGRAVAMDGNHILISAPRDDTSAENAGQVHLFDATTGALLRTFDDPTPTPGSFVSFGISVAIDGNNVLIGDPDHDVSPLFNVGQAYLFDATTGALLHTFNVPAPNANEDGHDDFGNAVAIEGNNVLIGAPGHEIDNRSVGQAYLFDATTYLLERTFDQPLGDETFSHEFGSSVAIDGTNVLIGAPSNFAFGGTRGQAHLFDATDGSLLQSWNVPVQNPPGFSQAFFGVSVDIDGDNVLIAASTTVLTIGEGDEEETGFVGRVYLYDAVSGGLIHTFDDPTPTPRIDINEDLFGDRFGESVAIDGDNILIGAFGDNTNGLNVGQAICSIPPPAPCSRPLTTQPSRQKIVSEIASPSLAIPC